MLMLDLMLVLGLESELGLGLGIELMIGYLGLRCGSLYQYSEAVRAEIFPNILLL